MPLPKGFEQWTKEQKKEFREADPNKVSDAWNKKISCFQKGDMKTPLVGQSSFVILFPQYREKYIKECWPLIEKLFKEYGIHSELDCYKGNITVSTTDKTWDPYIIINARDLIKLVARSVPFEQALKIFKVGYTHEVIKITSFTRKYERLIKRRERLIGNGTCLKTLEMLTDCYVLVHGKTVSIIGPYMGVAQATKVVIGTMQNIHPIHLLKALMIKRLMMKDPEMADKHWAPYLPKYAIPKTIRKAKKQWKKDMETKQNNFTQFPPERPVTKGELALSSGQFFVDQEEYMNSQRKTMKTYEEKEKSKEVADGKQEREVKRILGKRDPNKMRERAKAKMNKGKDGKDKSNEKVNVTKLKRKVSAL